MVLPSSSYTRRFHNKRIERKRTPKRKVVTFKLGNTMWAISIESVQRVLKEFRSYGTLASGRSLVNFDNEAIALVDLAQFFLGDSEEVRNYQYLIISTIEYVGGGDGGEKVERLAIPIPQLPSILEVSEDKFETVPQIYREGFEGAPTSGSPPEAIEKILHLPNGEIAFYLNLDVLIRPSQARVEGS
ncbi:chemotaxis protein CheW [Oxynema sp. CENA135]|uniref:chemotaxis protein CheW n=1 Tax=Oxynema sp. CENA135 TaxID=984206 RepID=UPI00190A0FE6|nr:chemotaxis protein CheW [Oxynema sp. CENA135]MBK4729995.1 chemotaxis protein CheW [Oxynema sp. CENA135]